MNASGLHVTARGGLDGSDLGTGSSSSLSSSQTLPSVSDSSLTGPEEIETRSFEDEYDLYKARYRREDEKSGSSQKYRNVPKYEDKTNLSKYHHYLFQQQHRGQQDQTLPTQSFYRPSHTTSMEYEDYGTAPNLPPFPTTHGGMHYSQQPYPRNHNQQRQRIDHENTGHPNDYFSYAPGETINIKERGFPQSNLKATKFSSRSRGVRQVRFDLQTVDEDAPIPCNPVDCPEARLALENARLAHALPSGSSHRTSGASLNSAYRQSLAPPNESPCAHRSTIQGPSTSTLYSTHSQMKLSPRLISSGGGGSSRGSFPGRPHAEGPREPPAATSSRFAYRTPARLAPDIAEVEGDTTFPNHGSQTDLVSSITHLGLLPPSTSFYQSPALNSENSIASASHDRTRERYLSPVATEPAPESTPIKPKEIFKKLLGTRTSRQPDTGISPFSHKTESGYSVKSVHLESKREWAFVAVSPDSQRIVGVCDRECFVTYSLEASGAKMLVYGEFDGEPLSIAVSNSHLAILTLMKLQVFTHHNGKKIYEWSSDKSVATDNFTSIAFANSGLELCAALTNGTIQFHYIPAEDQDFDPDEVTFRRGDPRMDVNLSSGDYAFTMSFSDDDMRFACGTQKRMLMVYEHRGPAAWELRNKFKFNDWEPGTHRRISGAIFCPDERFLFATTTSGRSSAYMRCIDNNKHTNCSQSYALPITKKGVTRSAMSPNGKAIALIDGDGTVYKCDFGAGSVLSDKQEFTKLPGTLIPARASWVSWTALGDLILLDKKGHLKIYELVAAGRSPW